MWRERRQPSCWVTFLDYLYLKCAVQMTGELSASGCSNSPRSLRVQELETMFLTMEKKRMFHSSLNEIQKEDVSAYCEKVVDLPPVS